MQTHRWSSLFFSALVGPLALLAGIESSFSAQSDPSVASVRLIEVLRYNPAQAPALSRESEEFGSAIVSGIGGAFVVSKIEDVVKHEIASNPQIKDNFSSDERKTLLKKLMSGLEARLPDAKEKTAFLKCVSKLSSAAVSAYVNDPVQRKELIRHLIQEVEEIIPDPHTNAQFVRALNFLGNELLGAVVEKIMQKQGVSNADARATWKDKLLAQFNTCTGASKTVFEAQACLNVVQAGLPHNLGLALTHQMARQELLGSVSDPAKQQAIEADLDRQYRGCVGNRADGAGRVQGCVLSVIRKGTLMVSDLSLRDTLAKILNGSHLEKVHDQVWGKYQSCIQASSSPSVFRACIDDLTISAGGAAVQEKVLSDPAVVSAIQDPSQRSKLASSQRTFFETCVEEQKKRNVRLKGMLSTEGCQATVENRVTLVVLKGAFEVTAQNNLGKNDPAQKDIVARANAKVSSCWSDTLDERGRQACVRIGVMSLAGLLTSRVLDKQVSADIYARYPGWKDMLQTDYNKCMQKNLPADIIHSSDRDTVLEHCAGGLRKKAAMVVAVEQVNGTFGSHLSDEDLQTLLGAQIQVKFAQCLGEAPSQALLSRCSTDLTREAAKYAAHRILPSELLKFAFKGGKSVPADTQAQIGAFLSKALQDLDSCVDKNVTLSRAEQAPGEAENCFKVAIGESSIFLGGLQFDSETAQFYSKRPEAGRAIRSDLLNYLKQCESEGVSPTASMDEFMRRVNECADKSSIRVTSKVGGDQVEIALSAFLKDTPERNFEKDRRELRSKLFGELKACLDNVSPGDDGARVECTHKLQRSATQSIGLAVGRAQVSSQLGAAKSPEVEEIEKELKSCTSSAKSLALGADLDACLKSYTLALASFVGNAKLKSSMSSALGSVEYANSMPDLAKAAADYRSCLDHLKSLPMGQTFMDGLGSCASSLTARARGILQGRLRNWFDNPTPGTDPSANARELLINVIPCLDSLIPATPEGDVAQAGVDAEGMLQAMVKFLKTYIDYDALKAEGDIRVFLGQLQKDLAETTPFEARRNLVKLLDERNALDQIIKALVRSTVADRLRAMPEDQRLAEGVIQQLVKKDTFDKIFSGPDAERIRKSVMDGLVRPVLVDGKSMNDPGIQKFNNDIHRDVAGLLADSSQFGTVVIEASIQKQMDDLDVVTRFFARVVYGRKVLDWSKVRGTPAGREAEEYIREFIVRPEMQGERISESEQQARMKKAKELVTRAATAKKRVS